MCEDTAQCATSPMYLVTAHACTRTGTYAAQVSGVVELVLHVVNYAGGLAKGQQVFRANCEASVKKLLHKYNLTKVRNMLLCRHCNNAVQQKRN